MMKPGAWILALALLAIGAGRADAQFVVVANESVPATALAKRELSDLFLKKKMSWSDGSQAVPVDQQAGAAARAGFSQAVHGRAVPAIQAHWQQQIFSGKGVPPEEKKGDQAVLAFVRSTPGAVGYISAGTPPGAGVKVLDVN